MKVLRDMLLVLALFAAILAVPYLMQNAEDKNEPATVLPEEKPIQQVQEAPPEQKPADIIMKRILQEKPAGTACGSLADARRHTLDTELILNGQGDSIVVGEKSVTDNMAHIHFSAGRGYDSMRADGPGYADIRSDTLESVERYEIANGQPNVLNFYASGLIALDSAHAVVTGDAGIDKVTLDPCLLWSEPVEAGNYLRYDAHDNDGNAASISVSQGVIIEKRAH